MANRIKELRKKKGLSQKEFAKAFNEYAPHIKNVSYATISRWESEKNEPKLETWIQLSDFFGVPVSYLQGVSNDLDGWLDWEQITGHSKSEIQDEIHRLETNGVISRDEPLQQKISEAVDSLEYRLPTSNQGAVKFVDRSIRELQGKLANVFLQLPPKENGMRLIPAGYKPKVKKRMSLKVYNQLMNLLDKTKWELSDIPLFPEGDSENKKSSKTDDSNTKSGKN